jgi:hypothetical protein
MAGHLGRSESDNRGETSLGRVGFHVNVAVTALANKMARLAWAMLRHGTTYEPNGLAA